MLNVHFTRTEETWNMRKYHKYQTNLSLIFSLFYLLLCLKASFVFSFLREISHHGRRDAYCRRIMIANQHTPNTTDSNYAFPSSGLYRLFSNYAWERMLSVGLLNSEDVEYLTKDSVKPRPDPSQVRIHIVSARPKNDAVIRYARYALLQTMNQTESNYDGTHVLNFVVFPQPFGSMAIPILGIDLVTLPGGKNLCAIDFQPILPNDNKKNNFQSWPDDYQLFQQKLESLHTELVKGRNLSWGGDLPEEASRFFSPYAVWTRFMKDEGHQTLYDVIYPAFCAYVDLYIELLLCIKKDLISRTAVMDEFALSESFHEYICGHSDYLTYRQRNDPARPMLRRLYGEDWAEDVIRTRLFPPLENL